MPPDDARKIGRDRQFISLEQDVKLRGWMECLDCSEAELREAVQVVGNSADAVRKYLSAMLWKNCYERVQLLSPRAAKLAARMLSKDPFVSSNWTFSLDLALTSRAKGAGPITPADLKVIAVGQRSDPVGSTGVLDEDQQQAWEFAAEARAFSNQSCGPANGAQRRTTSEAPQAFIWDPRTPTPDEKWLLAFSDEFHRLAQDRVNADDISKCAIERLATDGHRDPVAVAREQFITGRHGPLDAATLRERAALHDSDDQDSADAQPLRLAPSVPVDKEAPFFITHAARRTVGS